MFNTEQVNSMEQFNVNELNSVAQFNSTLENGREQFYKDMQYNIDLYIPIQYTSSYSSPHEHFDPLRHVEKRTPKKEEKRRKREAQALLTEAKGYDKHNMLTAQIKLMQEQMKRI